MTANEYLETKKLQKEFEQRMVNEMHYAYNKANKKREYEKKHGKLRIKIFNGRYSDSNPSFGTRSYKVDECADKEANLWLENHPFIEILDMKYSTEGDRHSICILYKELSD